MVCCGSPSGRDSTNDEPAVYSKFVSQMGLVLPSTYLSYRIEEPKGSEKTQIVVYFFIRNTTYCVLKGVRLPRRLCFCS